MSAVKKYNFPYRLPLERLVKAYVSPEEAFAKHDYLYAARFAQDNPELRGCALLMLGNRVGGERMLGRHDVRSARSCFYRAYAAWQDGDNDEACRWLAEARAMGGMETRLGRLAALMERQSFRMLFHWDIHNKRYLEAFLDLPGIEMIVTRHLHGEDTNLLPPGCPLHSLIPHGPPLDLVLIDDLKMTPVGIGDCGAPVVANIHDIEWYYEFLDRVLPDIDLLSTGASSEAIETGGAFGTNITTYFFPPHMSMPESVNIAKDLADTSSRTVDIFYSGSLGHDFYRYKKQAVLPLARLDQRFSVKIEETFYPVDALWKEMGCARFSFMSSRYSNYISTRAIEAVSCGTLHLIEEEDGNPYLFSEHYDCFPVYRRDHVLEDVEKHLHAYAGLIGKFRLQASSFEDEFRSVFPNDRRRRAMRYLRHALFMTHVEGTVRPDKSGNRQTSRNIVYMDEPDRLVRYPSRISSQFVEQTAPRNGLRHALAFKAFLLAQKKTERESFEELRAALLDGIAEFPDSLAMHHVLGVCERILGLSDDAEKTFDKVTSGRLRLEPGDPPPLELGRLNSFYWINDARIRARCVKDAKNPIPVEDIWVSYGWANRAEMALDRADYGQAAESARRALDLFMYNEDVQRLYLRAAFGLASSNQQEWIDIFLQSFKAACHNDYTVLHDFAAPAFHLFTEAGCVQDARAILEDLKQYLARVKLMKQHYILYEEFIPFMRRYGIPHTCLDANVN